MFDPVRLLHLKPDIRASYRPLVLLQLEAYVEHSASSVEDVLAREDVVYLTQKMNYLKIMRDRWHGHYKHLHHAQEGYRTSGSPPYQPKRVIHNLTSQQRSGESSDFFAI